MRMGKQKWIAVMLVMAVACTSLLALPQPAQAQTAPAAAPAAASSTDTPGQCTSFQERQKIFTSTATSDKPGLLSEIYLFIKDVVGTATKKLFSAFTSNANYQKAVYAAITLMVVIFGVGFTIGVIQASFAQVLMRLIKIGIIATVISPGGWTFFSDYAVKFFMDGTDELVKGVIQIGSGCATGSACAPPAGATPFYQLDKIAEFLIQPDTISAITGSVFSGPYGMAMGGLMGIAIWGFISLIIQALRLYATTFVARSLLLGIAPIFIVFLLFDRTKNMFSSWLNALVSLSLQPVLMFTFLSFFVILIETASKDMFNTEFCWTEYDVLQGSTVKKAGFRPVIDGETVTSQMSWDGSIQCMMEGKTKSGKPCPEFPINIIDVLSFLMLVYIAQRFSDVILRIANELSNAFISLDTGGKIDQFLSQQGKALGSIASGRGGAKKQG